MSGHSKWSSIKHKKAAADARRGKVFTKLIREITVAAKSGGPDPAMNSRLRLALDKARGSNVPSDTLKRAIAKGSGESGGADYIEIVYEGYGPHNVAVVIEALTDNRNRTAASIRHAFTKFDGSLGSTNSVLFMFERKGAVTVPRGSIDEDALTEYVLDAGAENMEADEDAYTITCPPDQLDAVRAFLEEKSVEIESAELQHLPQTRVRIEERDQAQKVLDFLDALEDDDDVQRVFSNFDIDDRLLGELA